MRRGARGKVTGVEDKGVWGWRVRKQEGWKSGNRRWTSSGSGEAVVSSSALPDGTQREKDHHY